MADALYESFLTRNLRSVSICMSSGFGKAGIVPYGFGYFRRHSARIAGPAHIRYSDISRPAAMPSRISVEEMSTTGASDISNIR